MIAVGGRYVGRHKAHQRGEQDMRPFSASFTPQQWDVDFNGNVNDVVYFEWADRTRVAFLRLGKTMTIRHRFIRGNEAVVAELIKVIRDDRQRHRSTGPRSGPGPSCPRHPARSSRLVIVLRRDP